MCAFHYDEQVRDRSGVRYLKFDSYNGQSFYGKLDDGFVPDFKSLAECCETARDGEALADVCGRALWSVYKESPVAAMSKRFDEAYGQDRKAGYSDMFDAVGKRWLAAYRSTFQEAMCDAYAALGDKQPDVSFAFVHHLDKQSFKCLAGSVQAENLNPVQRDILQRAREDSVPPLYGSAPKHAELNGHESGTSHYGRTVASIVDRSLAGLVCQADLKRDPAGFAASHMDPVREHYAGLGRDRVDRYFGEETRLCDSSLRLFERDDKGLAYGLDAVGLGRAGGPKKLAEQVLVLAEMCSTMHRECAGIADGLVVGDSVKDAARVCANRHYAESASRGLGRDRSVGELYGDHLAMAHAAAEATMLNAVAQDTLGIYDDLAGRDYGLAGCFMDGLSDGAYANVSRVRPTLPAREPEAPGDQGKRQPSRHYVGDMELSGGPSDASRSYGL